MSDQKKFIKSVIKNIERYRKEKGFSFSELAAACNLEKSSLVRTISKESNISIGTLYKISKGLDVPINDLLKF
ncbi:MAG: helix-turn-helix protein [Bacteroidetes bacterium]|jgi:transcriptional regulator with XRE-family HTH domain|nr:helix-turn-helix protein [Bacteroidota bacterium]